MDYGLLIVLLTGLTGCAAPRRSLYVVTVPVADLRVKPGSSPIAGTHDPFEDTQLLYGEPVRFLNTQEGWAYVEAIEQPEYTHHRRWQGYPGWVRKDALQPLPRPPQSNAVITAKWAAVWADAQAIGPHRRLPMGTKLFVTNASGDLWSFHLLDGSVAWISRGSVSLLEELQQLPPLARRRAILRAAEASLGDPYFWGGRSPYAGTLDSTVTGVDCSGLVNLAYRTAGLNIPRDSHEQRLRARTIVQPEPGDLIFLSEAGQPEKIIHVMLYAGDGWVIEGPGTGLAVRRISVAERLGRPIEQIRPGDRIGQQTIYFGTYFEK